MRLCSRSVTALALSVTTVAHGGSVEPRISDHSFEMLDRNGDHRLSRSEAGFDRTLSLTFADLDTNGDGYITPIEFAVAEQIRAMLSERHSSRPFAR